MSVEGLANGFFSESRRMPFVDFRRQPTSRDLFWFGVGLCLFGGSLAAYGWWRDWSPVAVSVLATVAVGGGAAGCLRPGLLRRVFTTWMLLTAPIGFVVGYLILGIVYFGVLTPCGLISRFVGRDPLQLTQRSAANSYWRKRPESIPNDRYFRQF